MRRRPPVWLLFAAPGAGLQLLGVLLASVTWYVSGVVGTCAAAAGQCLLGWFAPVHPFVGLGLIAYLGGAALMVVAIVLLRNSPTAPQARDGAA